MALLKKRIKAIVAALLAAATWTLTAQAQAPMLEYQVKASYLYNFARFITWPEDVLARQGNFNLCIVGAERFGSALDTLVGERVNGQTIALHRLEQAGQARASRCHLLFITGGRDSMAAGGPERGLLTIGETPGFLERGGIINLVEVNGRIRFEIRQPAARQAGLVVSSQLLSLAIQR
jgi:hypothetical protein